MNNPALGKILTALHIVNGFMLKHVNGGATMYVQNRLSLMKITSNSQCPSYRYLPKIRCAAELGHNGLHYNNSMGSHNGTETWSDDEETGRHEVPPRKLCGQPDANVFAALVLIVAWRIFRIIKRKSNV